MNNFRLGIWNADKQIYEYLQDKLDSENKMVFSIDRMNAARMDMDRARNLGKQLGGNYILETWYETVKREDTI